MKLLARTNFNLGELYKLKSLSKSISHVGEHTYNNLNFLENIPVGIELQNMPLQEKDPTELELGKEEYMYNEDSPERY